MRCIITVTEYPSMPGRFTVKSDAESRERRYSRPADVRGAAAAAAKAMEFAQRVGSTGYQIFAPEKVTALIPADMRGRL